MPPDGCSTYYDLAKAGYDAGNIPVIALILFAMGAGQFISHYGPFWRRFGALVIWGLSFTLITWMLFDSYSEYRTVLRTYVSGRAQTAAGPVYNFVAIDIHKRDIVESFWVDGKRFSYSPPDPRIGFRQIHAYGSPIRNGLPVRVAYVGDSIVRLELCKGIGSAKP